jgi:transglutaminase-like putative cysteine protease
MMPHDWLTGRLGATELPPTTDRGDASGTGYWSPATGEYRPDLLRMAFGREIGVPRVAAPAEIVGTTRTGAALAAGIAAEGMPVGETALEISRAIGTAVEYVTGVTGVNSTAREAWAEGKGVCQDMAHLVVGALRSVGIPARYVSGYLHPDGDAPIGTTVTGESHAWVEWWAGEWVGYDPTNRAFVAGDHVVVGRGREYGDVPPFKGVYAGAGSSRLTVTVETTRLADG